MFLSFDDLTLLVVTIHYIFSEERHDECQNGVSTFLHFILCTFENERKNTEIIIIPLIEIWTTLHKIVQSPKFLRKSFFIYFL